MASSTASTTTPLRHPFERRAEDVKPLKSDINALIFDYLMTEGYPSAADKFSKEANIRPQPEQQSLVARRQIIQSIHSGKIQEAIESLNDLEPQVLDSDLPLHFSLLRLQLIELIRKCISTPGADIEPALNFATTQLAPRAPTNKDFMEDLERTMALLVFPPDKLDPPLAALLEPSLRQKVADNVNKAILTCQTTRRDAAIRGLVRLRAWAEDTARQSKKDLPSHLDLGLDGDDNDGHENGHEAMMT